LLQQNNGIYKSYITTWPEGEKEKAITNFFK
jgi:hypothetical protein